MGLTSFRHFPPPLRNCRFSVFRLLSVFTSEGEKRRRRGTFHVIWVHKWVVPKIGIAGGRGRGKWSGRPNTKCLPLANPFRHQTARSCHHFPPLFTAFTLGKCVGAKTKLEKMGNALKLFWMYGWIEISESRVPNRESRPFSQPESGTLIWRIFNRPGSNPDPNAGADPKATLFGWARMALYLRHLEYLFSSCGLNKLPFDLYFFEPISFYHIIFVHISQHFLNK